MIITCPYCGMNNWIVIQPLTRRGSENYLAICRCNNCNKLFYLYKTRRWTNTYKLEEGESQ
ncbi:hypothetical protein [Vulcanisaeta thermophila]|uniref:hypothetical protein n=1 Tax=Vulcanisaeta thermophila TaxID=867917 RepID=UPI0009FCD015|nr:hypothetical protein [Vulcanisaeta thermophila]